MWMSLQRERAMTLVALPADRDPPLDNFAVKLGGTELTLA